jgi:anti-sigma factor RsiW
MMALMPTDDLTCQELVELVTAYLENALSLDDRRRFDAHLAECELCTEYLKQMRLTIGTLGHLSEESISTETLSELQKAFRAFRPLDNA